MMSQILTDHSAQTPATPTSSFWFERHWRALVLLLQPFLLTLINPNWLYNPAALNVYDTWYYTALFRYFPDFSTAPKLDLFYFLDRLSWILPGHALYTIFPPAIANGVLHLAVYGMAVFSLYGVAHYLFGRDAAVLMALCLGGYTWFLRAVGHDYLDGVGVAYYSASFWFATQALKGVRYKMYWMLCGVFMALTLVTQLVWVIFLPLIVVFYLIVDHQQARRPLITNLVWLSIGGGAMIGVLMLVNLAVTGEWNIFKVSIAFITQLGSSQSDRLLVSLYVIYGRTPTMWLVLPCFLAVLAVIRLARPVSLDAKTRLYIRLIVAGFALTFGAFIGLQALTQTPYFIVYLYISMGTPWIFLLFAALIKLGNTSIPSYRAAIPLLMLMVAPVLLVTLVSPLEAMLLNPLLVWPLTVGALLILSIGLMRRQTAYALVGGFALLSVMLGGGNGVLYHDRLKNYRLFMDVDATMAAIVEHHPTLTDFSDLIVWQDTQTHHDSALATTNLFWGSANWEYINLYPQDFALVADATQDVVWLTDDPTSMEKVKRVLGGAFSMEVVADFDLTEVDPTGQYRGYILRLSQNL